MLDTNQIPPRGAKVLFGCPPGGSERTARGGVMKEQLVSVIEDDQFFRDSMRRLMRSLGYTVEAFPSAADFLASPPLPETACLIAALPLPAMTGFELYQY